MGYLKQCSRIQDLVFSVLCAVWAEHPQQPLQLPEQPLQPPEERVLMMLRRASTARMSRIPAMINVAINKASNLKFALISDC